MSKAARPASFFHIVRVLGAFLLLASSFSILFHLPVHMALLIGWFYCIHGQPAGQRHVRITDPDSTTLTDTYDRMKADRQGSGRQSTESGQTHGISVAGFIKQRMF